MVSSLKVPTYCRASRTHLPPQFCVTGKTIQYWFHSRAQPELVPHQCECLVFGKFWGVIIHYRNAQCITLLPIVFLTICLQTKCSTSPPNLEVWEKRGKDPLCFKLGNQWNVFILKPRFPKGNFTTRSHTSQPFSSRDWLKIVHRS